LLINNKFIIPQFSESFVEYFEMMEVAFDKVYFREILLRDKGFLYELYKGQKLLNRSKISGAAEFHLNTLIQLCHLIMNNAIPMLITNYEKLRKAHRIPLLKNHFKANKDFLEILEGSRENKVYILRQLSSVFPFLLASLFEE
jgi:hypothetical protein